MKKKLTVNRLALGNLKARKKQYAIMILGIILAMIFSSSAIFFASCINTTKGEIKNSYVGKQNYIVLNTDEKELDNLVSNQIFESYATYETIGYAYCEDEEDKGVSVSKLDDKAQDIYYLSYAEGSYPQHKGEIAIEQTALSSLGIKAKVGDTITLNLLANDGENYVAKPVEKEYKLVGIVKDKRSNIMYSEDKDTMVRQIIGAYVSAEEEIELGGKARCDALVFIPNSNSNDSFIKVEDYFFQHHPNEMYYFSTNYSNLSGYVDYYSVAVISIILAVVFYIASGMAIINSFSSNLNDRKKQIGMMRTVGTTKRQVINIFGREAFIIALIASPVSVALSYFAVKLMTLLIKDVFVFKPEPWLFPLCILSGICSVMLSAMIPLIKASKISPMQAVRNTELSYTQKKKKIKSEKQYDVAKLMAKRTLAFNKGKQVTVCIFLVIIVLIGTWGSGFIRGVMQDINANVDSDYTMISFDTVERSIGFLNMKGSTGFSNNDIKDVYENEYIERVNPCKSVFCSINKDEYSDYEKPFIVADGCVFESSPEGVGVANLNADNFEELLMGENCTAYKKLVNKFGIQKKMVYSNLCAYDTETLEKLKPCVASGKIDIEKINSGEEIVLVADKSCSFIVNDKYDSFGTTTNEEALPEDRVVFSGNLEYKVGDEIDLSVFISQKSMFDLEDDFTIPDDTVCNNKTVKIGAIVNSLGDYYELFDPNNGADGCYRIFTSFNVFDKLAPNVNYSTLRITATDNMTDEVDAKIMEHLQDILNKHMLDSPISSKWSNMRRNQRNGIMFMLVAIVIVVLMLSICVSIINNSLTAQIRAGKRQMGTLRAVGASQKEMVGSYVHQLASMLLTGSVIGFALYFLSYGAMYVYQIIKYRNSTLVPVSIVPALIACLIIFGICSLNLMVKIKKEMKNSIIENIREL